MTWVFFGGDLRTSMQAKKNMNTPQKKSPNWPLGLIPECRGAGGNHGNTMLKSSNVLKTCFLFINKPRESCWKSPCTNFTNFNGNRKLFLLYMDVQIKSTIESKNRWNGIHRIKFEELNQQFCHWNHYVYSTSIYYDTEQVLRCISQRLFSQIVEIL